ncbi:MAG: DUF2341 domain-containing protein [Betaproteobacteria bacterium]|nr:DUF2341 domain-containing protein [Betaproteobacteria bacterium]
MKYIVLMLVALLAVSPASAWAWWNAEWAQRRPIVLDTSAGGADVKETLSNVVVPVRLHTGNFDFLAAKEDGSDLRFVSADDKLVLKHHVESFDSLNELAIVWVQVPRLAGASNAESIWLYYGNFKAPSVADAKGTYDPSQLAVLHFAEGVGLLQDAAAYGQAAKGSASPAAIGLIGGAAALDGSAPLVLPAWPALKLGSPGGFTFSAWVKPENAEADATLFAMRDAERSFTIGLERGRLFARFVAKDKFETRPLENALPPAAWSHIAVTLSDRLVVYVNGEQRAAVAANAPHFSADGVIGENFAGELDEVQIAAQARSADWVKLSHAAQAADGRLIRYGQPEAGESGSASYLGILLGAVTLDGWVVIAILALMMLVSFAVMIAKAIAVFRTANANLRFRQKFGAAEGEELAREHGFDGSSLFRVYRLGIEELRHRFERYDRDGLARSLSPQALGAIKASIDAGLVRENERLNSQMVLLTIAISGGPFLGLLGTVVGVMITFAAIAAAGDVNVNAIAPGIAAALVATVAGLGVAIPALFGYNYLASRIRGISNDTAVFADELITRLAEKYAP